MGPQSKSLTECLNKMDEHIDKMEEYVRKKHSNSWSSWAKGRAKAMKKNITDTGLAIAGQASNAAFTGVGIAAIAGAAAAGTAAAAATGIAIPVIIAALATVKWGFDRNSLHNTNLEIREWFYKVIKEDEGKNKTSKINELTLNKAVEWLAWFGTEGFQNMANLGPKYKEAKLTYDNTHSKLLAQSKTVKKNTPQFKALEEAWKNELGADFAYLKYRAERVEMYPIMLQVAIDAYMLKKGELGESSITDMQKTTEKYLKAYEALGIVINNAKS